MDYLMGPDGKAKFFPRGSEDSDRKDDAKNTEDAGSDDDDDAEVVEDGDGDDVDDADDATKYEMVAMGDVTDDSNT